MYSLADSSRASFDEETSKLAIPLDRDGREELKAVAVAASKEKKLGLLTGVAVWLDKDTERYAFVASDGYVIAASGAGVGLEVVRDIKFPVAVLPMEAVRLAVKGRVADISWLTLDLEKGEVTVETANGEDTFPLFERVGTFPFLGEFFTGESDRPLEVVNAFSFRIETLKRLGAMGTALRASDTVVAFTSQTKENNKWFSGIIAHRVNVVVKVFA